MKAFAHTQKRDNFAFIEKLVICNPTKDYFDLTVHFATSTTSISN